jgi:hypothetical protein
MYVELTQIEIRPAAPDGLCARPVDSDTPKSASPSTAGVVSLNT